MGVNREEGKGFKFQREEGNGIKFNREEGKRILEGRGNTPQIRGKAPEIYSATNINEPT